jgi:hypothetical protein
VTALSLPPAPPTVPVGTPGTTRPPALAVLATAATVGLFIPWMVAEGFVDLARYRGHGLSRRWGLALTLVGPGAYLLPYELDHACRAERRASPMTFRIGFLMTSPIIAWLVFALRGLWVTPSSVDADIGPVKLAVVGVIYLGWLAYAAQLQRGLNAFWVPRGAPAPRWVLPDDAEVPDEPRRGPAEAPSPQGPYAWGPPIGE